MFNEGYEHLQWPVNTALYRLDLHINHSCVFLFDKTPNKLTKHELNHIFFNHPLNLNVY